MNEPKLRFKADDGSQFPDWNEKTFNDVADYKKGPFGSALKKEIFVPKSNDTVKVYEQQNAISKDWKLERYFVTNEYFQSKMKSFAVSGGDIIVSCAGTIGEMYELPHDAEEGIINQALMRVRIKKSVINSMIFRCVFDKMISTEGVKISNGSALKNIPPFADMKKQSVFVPSLPEQQKIAEFLSTIDTVIEKQKETVSAWEERKKGVMQKLFSQEVRFKADDGNDFPEWEEKNVEDVCSVSTGKGNTQDKVDTGAYRFYVRSPIVEHSDSYLFDEEAVITVGDGVGTGKVFHYVKGKYNLHQRCYRMYDFRDVTGKYFYYFFSTNFYRRVKSMSAKTSVDSVRMEMITKMKILVPCLAEQQKIADCLSSLDEVIEKKKATLAAWEELKKGLLQQMFV